MSLANEYAGYESGSWARTNPSECPCGGRGWFFSDLDTTHRCPLHGGGVPHPEDENAEFDMAAHLLAVHRAAWASFRTRSGLPERVFRARVVRLAGSTPSTPAAWVNAAQAFVDEVLNERARQEGFSCRLEAALTVGGREWYAH